MKRLHRLALASALLLGSPARAAMPAVYVQVPVVLDVHGLALSHYTSDLTVVNLGTESSPVELTYIGSVGPTTTKVVLTDEEIAPRNRFYVPDVIAYLRSRGLPLPDDGTSKVGTLLVRLPLLSDETPPFVGSRISTPSGGSGLAGSYGTYALGVPVGSASTFTTSLYGFRENAFFRTNLGLVHAGGGANAPIELRVLLFDGETGFPAGEAMVVTLQPGQWKQFTSVLSLVGLRQGWARVSRSAGTDQYLAYAVVNDGGTAGGGTSDGSWIDIGASEGTLPIVLSSGPFKTELVLTNESTFESTANLYYVSADALGATSIAGAVRVTLPPRSQVIEPDALALIRRLGLGIPEAGAQGGTLRVTGAAALARVYSPNPDASVGGTFGLAFPAVPSARRAKTEAWIFGLRQDGASRSNVAVANCVATGETIYSFEVTVYDAARGTIAGRFVRGLRPGQWYQWNGIAADAHVTEAYARVRCLTVGCDFIAYGVVNDGAAPGQGTSDGSYVRMVNVQ